MIQNNTSPPALAWEAMQFQYACCGAYDYQDFGKFDWQTGFGYNYTGAIVPPSCCMQIVQYEYPSTTAAFVNLNNCLSGPPDYTNFKGCYFALIDSVAVEAHVVIIVFASLIALEVIVILLSMHLCGIKHHKVGHSGGYA